MPKDEWKKARNEDRSNIARRDASALSNSPNKFSGSDRPPEAGSIEYSADYNEYFYERLVVDYYAEAIVHLRTGNEHLRNTAMVKLQHLGPKDKAIVPALVRALRDKEPSIRSYAAHALEIVGNSTNQVVDGLKRALRDKEQEVRLSASKALEKIVRLGEESNK